MPTKSPGKPRRAKYGMLFPGHWSVLDIELYCFKTARSAEQGGLGQEEHFWRIVAYLWGPKNPIGNRTKVFIRNPWSESMIHEACEQRYIGIGGPAACSKSETFALWLLINYLANPRNVLGIMLSTSLKEARKRIWGSLVELVRAIPAPGLPLKVADSLGIIRYDSPSFKASDKSSLSLIAAERKQEKEAIGKLIGMHNNFVIVVADELSELTDSILEYALPGGNLTSNPRYQFVGLANPDGYYDSFAKLWKPKEGWLSISVESERWETEHGIGLHFDAMKSPNVLAGRIVFPLPGAPDQSFLPTIEKIEDAKKAEGGENSIRFWRMVRGFMSPIGQEDLIYNQVDIVKFKGDEPAIWNDEPTIKGAALDPGFTNGGDRSIATLGTIGTTIHGIRTLCFELREELVADVTNKEEGHSEQIARLFKDFCARHGVSPENAAVDSTGAGGPFCDIVNMVWSTAILRVNFGGRASDQPVSMTDPALGVERYHNRVTEIWYSGKELLRQGQLKGISPELAREMCIRRYGTTGVAKRIYAESKLDMKLRTGGKSPDIADSAFILVALCRERHGFTAILTVEQRKTTGVRSWRNLRAKLNAARHQQPTNLNYAPRYPGQSR
jgi:hypothetical protein